MHTTITFIIASHALVSLADIMQKGQIYSRSRHHSHVARAINKTYTLQDMYQGEAFFSQWDFFAGDDPTHGNVIYQSQTDAQTNGLAYVQEDGTTVLAVDDTTWIPEGGKRNSVRISSKKHYNGGLFIADFWAMPHGCSVWPAYWSVGPNWPNGGEIDILEGVHDQPTNQYTLHTGPTESGCTLSTNNIVPTGNPAHPQCATIHGDNTGCSFHDTDTRSYGKGFNLAAGGVFAHLWDANGITVWHFARAEIPADITAQKPDTSGWGPPVGFWSSMTCDMASHFYDHVLTLDTTICGDWGNPTYASAGCPGTCSQAVSDPRNYILAKWKINYIAVYQ